ncbi:unnamed protein product [Rhizophagus irregularis]|nr:unnamed protein product [Rhizophagus irregularis]
MKIENILNVCKFHSTDRKRRIRIITENIDIPVTMKEIVLVGMKLCQTHYNRYVINETHNFRYNKSCSHPKHELYKTQSKGNKQSKKLNLEKVPKRLIEVLGLDGGEELKQLELDFQEILEHITIPNEVSLSDKIIKMSNILYHNQHKLNQKPIYEPTTFKIMLEAADKDLKKLVSLCYFLASINNKYINSIKADIGSYLQTSDASSSSIDTLANIGFSIRRMTVDQKIFILNIDDYHNIHRHNKPTLLETLTHNIFHFVTILLNSNSNIAAIPYCSNNILIHNPKGIDFKLIIKNFEDFFMKQIGKSYYEQNELWKQFLIEDSYENRVENLNVHDYDGRIQNHQELRSLNNSKLVDFILHSLYSTKDYIECLDILFKVFESSIRSQTVESNTALQIIQKAKIIDVEKNSNLSFKEAFINSRNPVISQVRLNYLEKKVSLFLFSIFDEIFHNLGNTNQVNNNKYSSFALPTFKINVDIKALPLAWNTKSKPSDDKDKFWDAEKCLLSNNNNIDLPNNNVILICGHGFHKECLTLYNDNCNHCFNYLSSEIKKNINSLTERLNTPLKDNEKPLIEKNANNNINKDIDENIQDIMENLEQNIDNQFEILYQKWSDYYDNLY